MLAYLTEIISKGHWETHEKYGKRIWKGIDVSLYKRSLRFIKSKIFTPTNVTDKRFIFLNTSGNSLTKANIFVYNITPNDRKLIDLINATKMYYIPKNREKSLLSIGKAVRTNGKVLTDISYVVNSTQMSEITMNLPHDEEELEKRLESRKQKLEQLKQDPEKNAKAIAGIEKRIEQERAGDTYVNVRKVFEQYQTRLDEMRKGKYVIVLTYDTRSVASMSTGNSWRSCMNLDNGEYNTFVPTSIAGGAFVAYLAQHKDKVTLDDPIARVLCKAYYSNDTQGKNPDIIWQVSRYYGVRVGSSDKWFPRIVSDFLNSNNKPKYNIYKIAPFQYNDGDEIYARFDGAGVTETSVHSIKFPNSKKKSSENIIDDVEALDRSDRNRLITRVIDNMTTEIHEEASEDVDYYEMVSDVKNILENQNVTDECIEFIDELTDNNLVNLVHDTDTYSKLLSEFRSIENFDIRTTTIDDSETPAMNLYKRLKRIGHVTLQGFESLVRMYKNIDPEESEHLEYVLDHKKRSFERLEEDAIDNNYERIVGSLYDLNQGEVSNGLWNEFEDALRQAYDQMF